MIASSGWKCLCTMYPEEEFLKFSSTCEILVILSMFVAVSGKFVTSKCLPLFFSSNP